MCLLIIFSIQSHPFYSHLQNNSGMLLCMISTDYSSTIVFPNNHDFSLKSLNRQRADQRIDSRICLNQNARQDTYGVYHTVRIQLSSVCLNCGTQKERCPEYIEGRKFLTRRIWPRWASGDMVAFSVTVSCEVLRSVAVAWIARACARAMLKIRM